VVPFLCGDACSLVSGRNAATSASTALGGARPSRADAEASGVDGPALIGRHDARVVAVARCEELRESGVAEVAFAVAEDGCGR
jgi:hypothetical protein